LKTGPPEYEAGDHVVISSFTTLWRLVPEDTILIVKAIFSSRGKRF
jgi:hypothetical protein